MAEREGGEGGGGGGGAHWRQSLCGPPHHTHHKPTAQTAHYSTMRRGNQSTVTYRSHDQVT